MTINARSNDLTPLAEPEAVFQTVSWWLQYTEATPDRLPEPPTPIRKEVPQYGLILRNKDDFTPGTMLGVSRLHATGKTISWLADYFHADEVAIIKIVEGEWK